MSYFEPIIQKRNHSFSSISPENEERERLESEHYAIISNNDWKENEESRKLSFEYDRLPSKECMECGGKARITCQYH